ncbi:MAG: T9SS type A sorting domain-containing protein [Bacteroidota bacterium]
MKNVYALLMLSLCSVALVAQCMTVEIPLKNRIESADYVLEGTVIDQHAFWDNQRQNIYTSHTIQVYKTFAGKLSSPEYVEIVTNGGVVGEEMQIDHPSLQLQQGDAGIFILQQAQLTNNSIAQTNQSHIAPVIANQGFLKYDFYQAKAADPFHTYENVSTDLYALIERHTKQPHTVVQAFDFDANVKKLRYSTAKNITAFTPSSITAGTASVLTISGSGFGSTQGTIRFSDANNAGNSITVAALDIQILSWADNQIRVSVPSGAGTGDFQVETANNVVFTSSNPLTVSYNIQNINYNGDVYRTRLVDLNGSGGITWQYYTDFANGNDVAGASDAFLRALETWCSSSGVNWEVGNNTNVDVIASDGINIVRFDNGSELPSGVLGRATTRYRACFNPTTSDFVWYVSELDIVFNDNFNYNTGLGATPNGFTDLESVALHELGHTHLMGHTKNGSARTGDIMFPQISSGADKRGITINDESAGDYVFNVSTIAGVCSRNAISASSCANLPVELLHFDVEALAVENLLRWRTASELQNAGFYVERSEDTQNWESLDFVKGNGTTVEQQAYKYYDHQPLDGLSYYRLKQVDTDGKYEYSEIISIKREKQLLGKAQLSVYPSPAQNHLTIQLESSDLSTFDIQLLDAMGRIINTWENLEGNRHTIDLNALPNGTYTIIARGRQTALFKRFSKQ